MYRLDYKVVKLESKVFKPEFCGILGRTFEVCLYFQPNFKLILTFLLHSSALTFSLTLWSCETQFTFTAEIIQPRHALSAILTYQVLAATFFHIFEHSSEILLL